MYKTKPEDWPLTRIWLIADRAGDAYTLVTLESRTDSVAAGTARASVWCASLRSWCERYEARPTSQAAITDIVREIFAEIFAEWVARFEEREARDREVFRRGLEALHDTLPPKVRLTYAETPHRVSLWRKP